MMTKHVIGMVGAALVALVGVGCGESVTWPSVTAAPAARVAAPVVEAGPVVEPHVPAPDVPLEGLGACFRRDHEVAQYLRTLPAGFDTVMVRLSYGEVVYVDWVRRLFHVSGPRCEDL